VYDDFAPQDIMLAVFGDPARLSTLVPLLGGDGQVFDRPGARWVRLAPDGDPVPLTFLPRTGADLPDRFCPRSVAGTPVSVSVPDARGTLARLSYVSGQNLTVFVQNAGRTWEVDLQRGVNQVTFPARSLDGASPSVWRISGLGPGEGFCVLDVQTGDPAPVE
jgi:hypothetical protein